MAACAELSLVQPFRLCNRAISLDEKVFVRSSLLLAIHEQDDAVRLAAQSKEPHPYRGITAATTMC